MGFKPQRRIYVLEFEKEELNGLEVRARSVPLGQYLDIVEIAEVAGPDGVDNLTPEQTMKMVGAVGNLLESFADVLVSWNVEDEDGAPVPANLDGLRSQEFPFVMEIIQAWVGAVAGASDPLGPESSGGAPSVVASIPMETFAESLPN